MSKPNEGLLEAARKVLKYRIDTVIDAALFMNDLIDERTCKMSAHIIQPDCVRMEEYDANARALGLSNVDLLVIELLQVIEKTATEYIGLVAGAAYSDEIGRAPEWTGNNAVAIQVERSIANKGGAKSIKQGESNE